MKKSEEELWYYAPTRQSPAAIIVLFIRFVRAIIQGGLPIILVSAIQLREFWNPRYIWFVWLGAVLAMISAILHFYRFHFHIEDDHLLVSKGVLRRKKLDIPFERIQNIEFEENIIHQVLDVVRLKVDTAGSNKEEFAFHALPREKALELRDHILNNRTTSIRGEELAMEAADVQTIKQLSILDLVKVGVSQNHIRTLGIILVFIIGLGDDLENVIGGDIYDRVISSSEGLIRQGIWAVMRTVCIAFLIVFVGTIIYTIFRYYGLKWRKGLRGYIIESGLLNRREQSAPLEKIQIIQWIRSPLKRLFGIGTLKFRLASSMESNRKQTITVPGMEPEQYGSCQENLYGTETIDWQGHNSSPHLLFRRLLFIWFIPMLALTALAIFQHKWWIWVLLIAFTVITIIYQVIYVRKRRYFISPDILRVESGVFEFWHKLVSIRKIQAVSLKQSPYQRRNDLVTVVLDTAGGKMEIPYIKLDKARELRNFILYAVETNLESWM